MLYFRKQYFCVYIMNFHKHAKQCQFTYESEMQGQLVAHVLNLSADTNESL